MHKIYRWWISGKSIQELWRIIPVSYVAVIGHSTNWHTELRIVIWNKIQIDMHLNWRNRSPKLEILVMIYYKNSFSRGNGIGSILLLVQKQVGGKEVETALMELIITLRRTYTELADHTLRALLFSCGKIKIILSKKFHLIL
jgi:hypothetical protein